MVDIPVPESTAETLVTATAAGQEIFSFDFLVFDEDQTKVEYRPLSGSTRELVLNTDYTVSGLNLPNGGSINLAGITVAVGDQLYIWRDTPIEREKDWQPEGDYKADLVNREQDEIYMIMQELRRSDNGNSNDIIELQDGLSQEIADRISHDNAIVSLIGNVGSGNAPLFETILAVSMANISPLVNVVRINGYTTPGDGGDALYKRVTSEPIHAGKVQSADGAWWELAELVVTPYHFGASGYGIVDDRVALQNAVTFCNLKDAVWEIPQARFRSTGPITSLAPIYIRGLSMSRSRIIWDGGDGLKIISTSPDTSTIVDCSLETKGVAQGNALIIDNSALISGGVILPRAATHAKLHRVRVKGATGYTVDGWRNGIVGVSLLGLDIDNCRINGCYLGAYGSMPNSGKGVWFYGAGSPIQLNVHNTAISAWEDAVYTNDAEGIYIHNCEFVTVGRGYQCVNTVAESGLFITDTHIATVDTAININNMAEFVITGNVIYNVAAATPITGIKLASQSKRGLVEGNHIVAVGGSPVVIGIDITTATDCVIGTNTFSIGSTNTAIQLGSGSMRNHIKEQNIVSANINAIVDNNTVGGETGNTFEAFRGFAGNLNNISTNARHRTQKHWLANGASNAPSAWTSTAGAYVETEAFDANTAFQRGISPNISGTWYVRRKVAGTWNAWS